MKKSLGICVAFSLSVGAVHAEWFDKGAAYRTPDGKWRRAAIHVADDGIRVYARKHLSLVTTFPSFDYDKGNNRRAKDNRRDAGLTLLGGVGVVGSLALPEEPGWRTTCYYSGYYSSCRTEWREGRDPLIGAKTALISIGVISGIAAALVLRSKPPDYTFTDGPRSITVCVGKRDRERFERALSTRAISGGSAPTR